MLKDLFGGWGMDNFKGKAQGLLSDPSSMLSNPMVSGGLGLLAANYEGGNPWTGLLGGISSGKKNKEADEDRKRIEELRKQLAALIAQQGQPAGPPPGAGQGIVPPQTGAQNPMFQAPQMPQRPPLLQPPGFMDNFLGPR